MIRGILFGLIAGIVGAAAWVGIGVGANAEAGFVAWGIGGLVGFAVAFGVPLHEEGVASGVVAVMISVLAIIAGKYLVVSILVDKEVEALMAHTSKMNNDRHREAMAWDIIGDRDAEGREVRTQTGELPKDKVDVTRELMRVFVKDAKSPALDPDSIVRGRPHDDWADVLSSKEYMLGDMDTKASLYIDWLNGKYRKDPSIALRRPQLIEYGKEEMRRHLRNEDGLMHPDEVFARGLDGGRSYKDIASDYAEKRLLVDEDFDKEAFDLRAARIGGKQEDLQFTERMMEQREEWGGMSLYQMSPGKVADTLISKADDDKRFGDRLETMLSGTNVRADDSVELIALEAAFKHKKGQPITEDEVRALTEVVGRQIRKRQEDQITGFLGAARSGVNDGVRRRLAGIKLIDAANTGDDQAASDALVEAAMVDLLSEQEEGISQAIGSGIGEIKSSFSAFDVLWFFLAVGTAFKLGAGMGDGSDR